MGLLDSIGGFFSGVGSYVQQEIFPTLGDIGSQVLGGLIGGAMPGVGSGGVGPVGINPYGSVPSYGGNLPSVVPTVSSSVEAYKAANAPGAGVLMDVAQPGVLDQFGGFLKDLGGQVLTAGGEVLQQKATDALDVLLDGGGPDPASYGIDAGAMQQAGVGGALGSLAMGALGDVALRPGAQMVWNAATQAYDYLFGEAPMDNGLAIFSGGNGGGPVALYHTTPTGRTASNRIVFQRGPNGEIYGAAVKRISKEKLRKHLRAQILSGTRRRSRRPR